MLPWNPEYNALIYALAGQGTVGAERHALGEGQMAVHVDGDALVLVGRRDPGLAHARFEVLDPRRPAHPRARRRLRSVRDEHPGRASQAFDDYQAGRLGQIPADHI